MDKEQEELHFLGFFDIWKESLKIISTWRQLFLQIGLTLTLPLSFIYLAHIEINHLLLQNISHTLTTLAITANDPASQENALRTLAKKLASYAILQVAYIVFLLVFSLLSTSAVVYIVACIYAGKKVGFKQVFRVVPKVWKRLMVTFLCVMAIMFLYNFVFSFVLIVAVLANPINSKNMGKYVLPFAIFFLLYLAGVFYLGMIWQLADTISVLEESYGYKALRKSKNLMKGKMGISVAIFVVSNLCMAGVLRLYNSFVVFNQSNGGTLRRVGFGVISLVLLCTLILLGLVVRTVFYFVCKSYHREGIDKSALSDHLEVYHGEGYVLLKPKGIQLMEQV